MSAPVYTAERAKHLIMSKKIEGPYEGRGSLDLRGCDLSGVTLPTTMGGSLDLSGAKNPDPSQWWSEKVEATKRHCIAISDYALIQTDTDRFIAGCRTFTRKQALAHWGKPRSDNAERAAMFVAAIEATGGVS